MSPADYLAALIRPQPHAPGRHSRADHSPIMAATTSEP